MTKQSEYHLQVQFGDCDPAGIVYYPNYGRWMDAASIHFFRSHGVPPWRETLKSHGILGTPLLEHQIKYTRPSSYGDHLRIVTTVPHWGPKVFHHLHVVYLGDEVVCTGTEVRAFCAHHPQLDARIQVVPIPEFVLQLCQ